jgi:hypothetical protein
MAQPCQRADGRGDPDHREDNGSLLCPRLKGMHDLSGQSIGWARYAFCCKARPGAAPRIDQHVDRVASLGMGQRDIGQLVLTFLKLPVETLVVRIGKSSYGQCPCLEQRAVGVDEIVGFLKSHAGPRAEEAAGIDVGGSDIGAGTSA